MSGHVAEPEGTRFHEECYACPIGGVFLTARTAGPEAAEHLVKAASEMVAAMRSLLEAAEAFLDHQRAPGGGPGGGPGGEPRVRHIDVDG